MLKSISAKTYFLITYFLIGSFQFYAAFSHQLFVDEAFYWLEGQWLSWSYSEVPGWTPWTLALINEVFPQHQFFVRIPTLLAALSLPWLGIVISRTLNGHQSSNDWLTGLLMLALPILGVAGTLAVPDIWLIFFSLLAVWLLIQATQSKHSGSFIVLGLVLALGINVHLRFWLLIVVTSAVVFWCFRSQRSVILKLLKFTFPMVLLGLIPVFIFNVQHEFPLLSFQLKERHPWQFQTSHFSFFLTQIIVTTPWVFYLCFKNLNPKINNQAAGQFHHTLIQILIFTATIHWLVYAILGFFSDTLRLNVHWTLVSYVLLLLITANNSNVSPRLKRWVVVTGVTANLWLMIALNHWLVSPTVQSQASDRITQHATGWRQLSAHTDALLIQENQQRIVVDHFRTLAQLKFYSKQLKDIASLPHPLNTKHGRQKQLEIMGLLQGPSDVSQLLAVEHSALKLTEVIDFYQSTCKLLNGIELIDSLDINQGLKRYHYFRTNPDNAFCEIPPIVYYSVDFELGEQVISGWVLHNRSQELAVSLYDANKKIQLTDAVELNKQALGSNTLFETLDPEQYQLLEFKFHENSAFEAATVQLKLDSANQTIYSQRLILKH